MRIQKTSLKTPTGAHIVDGYSTSTTDGYSANYVNNAIETAVQDVYSTNEVKTNKVDVDGRPIYRKCFTADTMDFYGSTSKNIAHEISNLLRVIDINYSMYFSAGNEWYTQWDKIISKTANGTYIKLTTSAIDNYVRFTNVEIILEYTKTTD